MHDAFQVSVAIDKIPVKIESIFAYGDRLLVGTSTGQLRVYEVKEPLVAESDELPEVKLLEVKSNFSRRPIEQMDAIKEINVLVCLSDSIISLHDLKTYDQPTRLAKTAGANLFAIGTNIETDSARGPQIITKLAVAVRKRIVVFTWKDSELEVEKEYTIQDRVKAITWVGPNKICLGFAGEYSLMDTQTGGLTDLFAPSGPPDTSAPAGVITSSLTNLYNTYGIGAKSGKPLVTKLPNNEMLLAKDHVSIFLGLDGNPTRKAGIVWSGIPEEMGYSYPYVVAILPRHVEVCNIETQALVQQFELPQARILNQGKLLYIASLTTVWRLTPFSFTRQVDQLVAKKNFEEAISLLGQIEPILLDDKKEQKLAEIRHLYAQHLFDIGEYDEALAIFQELQTDPAEVVSLYPPEISGSLYKPRPHEEHGHHREERASTHSLLEKTHLSHENHHHHENGHSDIPANKRTPEEDLRESVTYLIRFLTDRRQKNLKLLQKTPHVRPASPHSSRLSSDDTDDDEDQDPRVLEMATLVDTVLLKSYMLTNDALVGPLLRLKNRCDVNESEKLLLERKKYSELVDLYNGKGLHKKALDLLSRLGQANEKKLGGVFPTILYLQKLGAEHFDLILEYSTWVLKTDPENGMQIFIEDLPEVEGLPRSRVFKHLEKISPNLAISYLEHVIHQLDDTTPEFHNKLTGYYMDQIQTELKQNGGHHDHVVESIRLKLRQFLIESDHYRAERVLSRLPFEDFYEERAILLSKLGEHDQALNIYVYKLKNYRMAEEYCNKVFHNNPEVGGDIYLVLLRVYLPTGSDQPLLEPALELLARHGSHINASEALRMLPSSTKLNQLHPFFEKYIRESNRQHNMNLIVKNLWKAEKLQTEERLVYYRSRSVKITEDRMCPQCNKRIGNSVFAVFPSGVVVHYSCKEKIENTKWKLA